MPSRLSHLLSLERLRTYEVECRRQAQASTDLFSQSELTKLADTFDQAIKDIEATLRFSDPTEGPASQNAWANRRYRHDNMVHN